MSKNFAIYENLQAVCEAIGKKKLTIKDTMPTASDSYEDISILYIGPTDATYTKGYVYRCEEVLPATDPKTYAWDPKLNLDVDLSRYKTIFAGTTDEWNALTEAQQDMYDFFFNRSDESDYFAVVDELIQNDKHSVTSGAVYAANEAVNAQIDDIVNDYSAKNILPYPYYQTTQKVANVDVVDNGDGTLTLNGTSNASAVIFRYLPNDYKVHIPLKNKKYKVSFEVENIWGASFHFGDMRLIKQDGTTYTYGQQTKDYIVDNTDGNYIGIETMAIYVAANTVIDNVTIKPMIALESIKDGTWEPYAETNRQLTENKMSFKDNAILGATNLWDIESVHSTGGNGGGSASYSNKIITVNCPAVLNSGAYIAGSVLRSAFVDLNGVSIVISFDVKGDSSFDATIGPEVNGTAETVSLTTEYQRKEYKFKGAENINTLIFYTQDASQVHTITVTNFMLTLESNNEDTYQPYAKTNKQLTSDLEALDSTLRFPKNKIVDADLNNITTEGLYYCMGNLTNSPVGSGYGTLFVQHTGSSNYRQIYIPVTANDIYTRYYTNNAWSDWNTPNITTGYFRASVTANTVKVISSSSDISEGTLPSTPYKCTYNSSGGSANSFHMDIHVDSGQIKLYSDMTQNVTVTWVQFNV